MSVCPSSGAAHPERARFCSECGAALSGASPGQRDVRKIVTVLFSDVTGSTALPELSLVVLAVILTLPMAGWMRFRGMPWRPIVEMSVVPIALAILIIGVAWAGIAPDSALQIEFGSFCGISCVGMFVVMLFRLDLYTGRAGHHTGHATRGAHAA